MEYEVHECLRAECRFRLPVPESDLPLRCCPRCGAATRPVAWGRTRSAITVDPVVRPGTQAHFLLDSVRSAFNVGSIFRIADGAGITQLHLCGITPTPQHRKVIKTSLGAEVAVPWSYSCNGLRTAATLRREGYQLWALESNSSAESLFACRMPTSGRGTVIVVGSELMGVDPGILDICDRVVRIPMWGIKGSLNVAVAAGIAAYWLRGMQATGAESDTDAT